MKIAVQSLLLHLVMTVLVGLLYPLAVTGLGEAFFQDKAHGQMVSKDGQVVGSRLIAQKIASPKYFWPRPSEADYNASSSNASNLGPTSADLKKKYDDRKKAMMDANPGMGEPPQDLLFASASGLDPEISPAAANYQLARIAAARNFTETQKIQLKTLVEGKIQKPTLGFIGDSRVNVLDLNMELDKIN